MAQALSVVAEDWTSIDARVGDVERQLAALRGDRRGTELRTSVMTHIAWVPSEWEAAARHVLVSLGELRPSRALLLLPAPAEPDGLDASVSMHCFPGGSGQICTELVELRLRGRRAEAPASVVAPLLLPDLPVFLRWRGEPPFGSRPFGGLIDIVDRLVVDSREWDSLPGAYVRLAAVFDVVAASDIVWARTVPWRAALAAAWPAVAAVSKVRVTGPPADALLLAGWLRARLQRSVELVHEPSDELEAVAVDCTDVEPPAEPLPTASELLSEQLDRFGRDPVYEEAVRAAAD